MIQQLDRYRTPPDWHPGAPLPVQVLWFCAGAALLSIRWLPGSAWRVLLLRARPAREIPLAPAGGPASTLSDRVCLSQGAVLCTGILCTILFGIDLRLGPIAIGPGAVLSGSANAWDWSPLFHSLAAISIPQAPPF
jgi:hypothetical protein